MCTSYCFSIAMDDKLDTYSINSRVSIRNQAPRLVILFSILVLIPLLNLHAEIVLQTSQSEGYIDVRRPSEPSFSLDLVPVCELCLLVKHRGAGYLYLSYTPLTDGRGSVNYQLYDANDQLLSQTVFFVYQIEGGIMQEVSFGCLKAKFDTPLQGLQSRYSSDISLHLMLEL